jgi:hypothetical protein
LIRQKKQRVVDNKKKWAYNNYMLRR